MTNPDLLLSNIEQLGRAYCARYLSCRRYVPWDFEKVESDWFEALKFFFGHSFFRGRRDEISNEFCSFAIDRLQHDILHLGVGEDGVDAYHRLRERVSEFDKEPLLAFKTKYRLGNKSASKDSRFAEEIAAKNNVIQLLTTKKEVEVRWQDDPRKKTISLGNDNDVLMVLDTLQFIAVDEQQNIYTYLRGVIKNDGVKRAYDTLSKLWAVKDKIAGLVIRDIGLMNPGLVTEIFEHAFPVDTWVRRLAKELGCTETTDPGIKKHFIDKCRDRSLDPLLVAAGLWYLGFNSLDILLKNYLGKYELGSPAV